MPEKLTQERIAELRATTPRAGLDDIGDELYTPTTVAAGGNDATLLPVVFHRATNTGNDITSYLVRPVWATQRRRGAYGRQNVPPF